jgi:hypothetical protein
MSLNGVADIGQMTDADIRDVGDAGSAGQPGLTVRNISGLINEHPATLRRLEGPADVPRRYQ